MLSPEDSSNTCATLLIRVNPRSVQNPATVSLTTDHAPRDSAAPAIPDGQAVVWTMRWRLRGLHPAHAIPVRLARRTLSIGEDDSPWHFSLREKRWRAPTTCPRV